MPSGGILAGVRRGTWQNYEPRLIAAANGAVVDPAYGAGQSNRGRYLFVPGGLCVAQIQIGRGITSSTGTADAYVAELPFPARRFGEGLGPHIIGQNLSYKTVTATPLEVFTVVALADPWTSLGGDEDRWCQFYIPRISNAGTGTWTGATASVAFAHGLGVTPNPADVRFVATSGGGANTVTWPWIISTDATNITVATINGGNNTPSGTDMTYGWSAVVEPPNSTAGSWLVGPKRPWPATFESLFFEVIYEPRTRI